MSEEREKSVQLTRQSKLTPTQRDEIVKRKSDGETPQELAAEFGVTTKRIRSL